MCKPGSFAGGRARFRARVETGGGLSPSIRGASNKLRYSVRDYEPRLCSTGGEPIAVILVIPWAPKPERPVSFIRPRSTPPLGSFRGEARQVASLAGPRVGGELGHKGLVEAVGAVSRSSRQASCRSRAVRRRVCRCFSCAMHKNSAARAVGISMTGEPRVHVRGKGRRRPVTRK